jgi:hypothetical protein
LRTRILVLIIIGLTIHSCGIFKTHHKNKLIDFDNNQIPEKALKRNGYYFAELEREAQDFDTIQGTKIKYLSVFFIYDDSFVVNISRIDGLTNYYCAEKETYKNTYENAHKTIQLMLESQNSQEKRTKRICGFQQNDISNKGLIEIKKETIKIQIYRIEMQNPTKDSFNSAYLYENNGIMTSDSSFVITSETEFRT